MFVGLNNDISKTIEFSKLTNKTKRYQILFRLLNTNSKIHCLNK